MIEISSDSGISNQDRKWLQLACKQAELSNCEQRHGAVIVKGGSVLAVGINSWRNDMHSIPIEDFNKYLTIHAEVSAIKRASNTEGATMYVARINKKGEPVFSRPCKNCYKEMKEVGIKKVIFTI